jgi:transcriptional regulator with XRE-family HTH domain
VPVYSSHSLRYDDLKLGGRIRAAREQQGLTLKQLGARVNTSAARLSQVENDRLQLDLQEVLRFADALHIPLGSLIPADSSLPYQISRDSEVRHQPPRSTMFAGRDGGDAVASPHVYTPLAELFVGRHLEPWLGRIASLEEHELQYCYHHEEEFAFALKGRLEFRIKTPDGECREELGRGDCVYFRSDLPHCFRSLDPDAAESLHIFCSSSASTDNGAESATPRAIAHTGDAADDVQRRLGERLRQFRERHGWSLARVAQASGLAERQVASIERGQRPIPVDAVLKMARAFGKPLRELIGLAAAVRPYYFVRRSKDIASTPSRRRRTPVERPQAPPSKTCQPLVEGFLAQAMYPYFLRMLNVDLETLTLHEHHGEEFIYVLEGELELTTFCGDRQVRDVLRAGDSCYIDSTVPHLLRSWTRNPYSETSAEVIDVFWCPLGEAYLFDS